MIDSAPALRELRPPAAHPDSRDTTVERLPATATVLGVSANGVSEERTVISRPAILWFSFR